MNFLKATDLKISKLTLIVFLTSAVFLIHGCAHTKRADDIKITLKSSRPEDAQKTEKIDAVVRIVKERNRTVEKSHEWLAKAYSSIMIKKLNNIPKGKYAKYERFLGNGTVYIVVHPAFYIFFQNKSMLSSEEDAKVFPSENIFERFYKKTFFLSSALKVLQEQERILRDFLEIMSTGNKLVILILPKNHEKHLNYGYINGLDEYARYINEVTNESESVIYMESSSYKKGRLSEHNLEILLSFLSEIGAQKIMLGGEYYGRCLEDFYREIGTDFGFENIYLVPEITVVSPDDLSLGQAMKLIKSDGSLDIETATVNLKEKNAYGKNHRPKPRIKNLPYSFYLDEAEPDVSSADPLSLPQQTPSP